MNVLFCNAHVIGFPEGDGMGGGGGGGGKCGTLQTCSAIAPPTGALFSIKSPTLSPVPGALQHANGYDLHFNEPSESYIEQRNLKLAINSNTKNESNDILAKQVILQDKNTFLQPHIRSAIFD